MKIKERISKPTYDLCDLSVEELQLIRYALGWYTGKLEYHKICALYSKISDNWPEGCLILDYDHAAVKT